MDYDFVAKIPLKFGDTATICLHTRIEKLDEGPTYIYS